MNSPGTLPARRYWFAAKRYGWGWGLPTAWQGWVVYVAYVGLLVVAAITFLQETRLAPFIASTILLSGVLMAVCWMKGEPPRWRWGK